MPELDSESSAIWHLLIDGGLSDEEQLEEIWEEHERTGLGFKQVLYNYDIITEDALLGMVADNLATEFVDIKSITIDAELIEDIPANIARMYEALPYKEEDGVVHIAVVEPMNYRIHDELGYVIGKDVHIVVAKPEDILSAMDHFYPEDMGDSVTDILQEMHTIGDELTEEEEDPDAIQEAANMTPIVRFVNIILYQAVKDLASDVHFEPFADEFKIRYRVDGVLYEMQPPPKHLALPVVSRVKVISGLNIAERRLPQDGRIEMRIAGRKIDLRVSSLPTQHGESVVLRILDRSVVNLDIEGLGMPEDVLDPMKALIAKPNGIILVTGPTGSGKTTTLYSCLRKINKIEDKLLTAEDPVEYAIEGLQQVPVNDAIGMTFARALKAFLRQDPDRIMVGEIRDLETASMAIQASLTGHLVMSTLHTNDAATAITRLIDMGVEPFLLSSTIEAVLAQRLVRRVCAACKTGTEPNDEELESLGLSRDDVGDRDFFYGKGCGDCNSTGYRGRIGIYELLELSKPVRALVNQRRPASDLVMQARKDGMRTLREHGVEAVLAGNTTVEEILKYT